MRLTALQKAHVLWVGVVSLHDCDMWNISVSIKKNRLKVWNEKRLKVATTSFNKKKLKINSSWATELRLQRNHTKHNKKQSNLYLGHNIWATENQRLRKSPEGKSILPIEEQAMKIILDLFSKLYRWLKCIVNIQCDECKNYQPRILYAGKNVL